MAKRGKNKLLLAVAAGAALFALRGKNGNSSLSQKEDVAQATDAQADNSSVPEPSSDQDPLYCGRPDQPYDRFYDYGGNVGGFYLDRADINAMGLLGDTSIVRARLLPEFFFLANVLDGEKSTAVFERPLKLNKFETIEISIDKRRDLSARVELFNPSDYALPLSAVAIKEIYLNEQRLYRDVDVVDHDDKGYYGSKSSSFTVFKDANSSYTPYVIPPRGSLFIDVTARGLVPSDFTFEDIDRNTNSRVFGKTTIEKETIRRVLFMRYNEPAEDIDGMVKLALNVSGANNEARTLTAGLYRGERPQGGIKALEYERQYIGNLFPDLFIAKDAELDQLTAAAAATNNERRFQRTFRIDLAERDYYVSERVEAISEALRRDYGFTLKEWADKSPIGRQKIINDLGVQDSLSWVALYTNDILDDITTPDDEMKRWKQAEQEGNSIDLESVIYWESTSEQERARQYS